MQTKFLKNISMSKKKKEASLKISIDKFKEIILADYRLTSEVRESGLQGRRDVLSGKGSFGIFGDGKELAQVAMAICANSLPSPKIPKLPFPESTSLLPCDPDSLTSQINL